MSKRAVRPAASPATETQRAAVAIRPPEGDRIAAEMADRMDAFWREADSYDSAEGVLPPFHILKSPVGTGKTTAVIAAIVRRKAAGVNGTVGMLLPAHDNVDEVAGKARAAGLVVETHRGQAHEDGGCKMRDKVVLLQQAGISAARLCKSKIDGQDVYCQHHPEAGGTCERMAQLARMLDADLMVSVHAYATQPPPAPFKKFAAIIVDEDLGSALIKTAIIDRAVLDEKRRAITPTRAEREERWGDRIPTEDDLKDFDLGFSEKRFDLVEMCKIEWQAGRDPAFRIASDPEWKDRLEAARTITSRAGRIAADISPKTTVREAAEYARQLTGRHIGLEGRLWRLMEERVGEIEEYTSLVDDGCRRSLKALDDRIWPFRDKAKTLQLSWSTEYSLCERPTLFMDASANPPLLTRILRRQPGEVTCRPIEANLRVDVTLFDDGTCSKSKYLPPEKAAKQVRIDAYRLTRSTQMFIAKAAAVHGDGGVLVVAPMGVESHLSENWTLPGNVDTLHFGHVAGFDFARNHRAAILIGALYPDVRTIDGLVAALTWRDDEPVDRMDPDGTGPSEMPFEAVDESVPMRDGTYLQTSRLEYRGEVANQLLVQIRDEQLTQALGRLRSIYREDVPKLYIIGNVVPKGLIVDRVTTLRKEAEDLGELFSRMHEGDGRIYRKAAEDRALTAQFVRFSARIDADPSFAASFHVVMAPDGTKMWMPGYVTPRLVEAYATECNGTVRLATIKTFGRPAGRRIRNGLSEEAQNFIEEMEDRRLAEKMPLRQRIVIRETHGPDADAEIIRVARQADEAWRSQVLVLQAEHKRRLETEDEDDDPFMVISAEALAIPIDF
ncbi:hypothetical protein [uncultured Aureimonas sp.]|uniref:hypothetical protein n=1 Tax=uncultured Aureimonas sp. TaxID=1604662 RepID=UPI0025E974D1|nr:hypothetical protein [uncultured Aureimonas sp.]